jgi:hypothetical protein
MIQKQVDLYYIDYKSDKEYHLVLESVGQAKYKVTAKFGPRGGTLTHVDKTKGTTIYSKALDIFNKTEREKRSKGYTDIKTPRQKLIERMKEDLQLWLYEHQWVSLATWVENYLEEQS